MIVPSPYYRHDDVRDIVATAILNASRNHNGLTNLGNISAVLSRAQAYNAADAVLEALGQSAPVRSMPVRDRLYGLLAEAPWDAEKVFVSLDDVREVVTILDDRRPR